MMNQFSDDAARRILNMTARMERFTNLQPIMRRRSVSASSAEPSTVYPAKITSKDGGGLFYNIDKYEDGIDSPSTGTAKIYILQLAMADTLPNGTWIIASSSAVGVTGGGNVP